ncbi:hypothetical protein HYN59_04540 [Flavobacterium album]|uniref:DUF2007 domain-containing protein n=1 Tax=Flavobacterium album TaxID=2175091 RepID=A0A2S1QVK2_9FLAO|nr:DUF2007 domain-containing protein [Flavobacterium album]AWH84428.1 hypothetical protein HYN59_04540 [Flavobacterium album]
MNPFVTAAVFTYPHEITVVKHLLQEAEITHYFENEAMAGIAPMYSHALGGIRLKVHPNDLDTVKDILDRFFYNDNLKIV